MKGGVKCVCVRVRRGVQSVCGGGCKMWVGGWRGEGVKCVCVEGV